MVFAEWEWLIPVLALIGFIIGFLITVKQRKIPGISDVIDTIVMKYLDERGFRLNDLVKETGLPDPVVKRAVKELERNDIVFRKKSGWFQLNDPLIFLSEKDMIRASRLTKDDNLVYGGYQNPFFSHVELITVYGIFLGAIIFAAICFFVEPAKIWLWQLLHGPTAVNDLELGIFLLFIIMLGMMTTDAIENLISIWSRERYSVVIGERSGIAFDTSYSDEYSGRIGRGRIRKVDLQISGIQKFMNYFLRVPIGDIYICCVPKEQGGPTIAFKNMPFPREMFFIIRSIQLKSLGWRKRHARTLMLWRARGAIPSIRF
ncbi:MAG: helix-turn-helix transcriptional regulator [Candidatus Helarchaeota archaeon]